MKKLRKFSLMIFSALIILCSSFVLTGCGKDDDICKLYVFSTVGGSVQINDNEELVKFGDEGSKIFTFKEGETVKFKAIADEGYKFVKWEYADDVDEQLEKVSTFENFELKVDDDDIVIRAVFALNGSLNYNISYISSTGYSILPEEGYTNTVTLGGNFKFKVQLDSNYSNSSIVVKANNQVLTKNNQGIYVISNINNHINIVVEGVVENLVEIVYTYNLDFETGVKSLYPDIVLTVPTCVKLRIDNNYEKSNSYNITEFVLEENDETDWTIENLIDSVKEFLNNNTSSSVSVKSFNIAQNKFITVNGTNIDVDWSLMGNESAIYDLTIVIG